MGVFPKTLPRAENGGINWTNTQFLADLRIVQDQDKITLNPSTAINDYEKIAPADRNKSDATTTYIRNRFKVVEQIQKDIYPPLQQYINLLNIEAWYAGRQKRKWIPLTKKPKIDEIITNTIPITSTSPRINVAEPDPITANPPPLIYSLTPIEVGAFLDFTVTFNLTADTGLTYRRYPPLITNWNNIPNNPINISDPSSFFLFSQLLTAYKTYKNTVLLNGWENGWLGCPRVEGVVNNNGFNGFGRSTSHILDNSSDNNSNSTLEKVIGTSISTSLKIIPKFTPAQITVNQIKKADVDLINGTLTPKVKGIIFGLSKK